MENIEFLEILKFDSRSKNIKGVNSLVDFLEVTLITLGFQCIREQKPNASDFLIAKTQKVNTQKKLLLSFHIDTVYSPLEIKTDNAEGKIYAAGISDMKGGVIAALIALKELKNDSKLPPNLTLMFSPEEEIATPNYTDILEREAKSAHMALVYESTKHFGTSTFHLKKRSVVVSRRGFEQYKLKISSAGGHSGTIVKKSERKNSIQIVSRFILGLEKLCNYNKLTTANVGMISGGTAVNVLAPSAEIIFEIRFKTISEYKRIRSEIDVLLKKINPKNSFSVNLEPFGFFPPLLESKINNDLANKVIHAGKKLGIEILKEKRGGGSEASLLSYFNPQMPVLDGMGVAGGAEHTPNEYCYVQSIVETASLTKELLLEFLDGKL